MIPVVIAVAVVSASAEITVGDILLVGGATALFIGLKPHVERFLQNQKVRNYKFVSLRDLFAQKCNVLYLQNQAYNFVAITSMVAIRRIIQDFPNKLTILDSTNETETFRVFNQLLKGNFIYEIESKRMSYYCQNSGGSSPTPNNNNNKNNKDKKEEDKKDQEHKKEIDTKKYSIDKMIIDMSFKMGKHYPF